MTKTKNVSLFAVPRGEDDLMERLSSFRVRIDDSLYYVEKMLNMAPDRGQLGAMANALQAALLQCKQTTQKFNTSKCSWGERGECLNFWLSFYDRQLLLFTSATGYMKAGYRGEFVSASDFLVPVSAAASSSSTRSLRAAERHRRGGDEQEQEVIKKTKQKVELPPTTCICGSEGTAATVAACLQSHKDANEFICAICKTAREAGKAAPKRQGAGHQFTSAYNLRAHVFTVHLRRHLHKCDQPDVDDPTKTCKYGNNDMDRVFHHR